jgi:predicted  nucleic acid-binding Zn-ribbon protein
MPASDEMVLQN